MFPADAVTIATGLMTDFDARSSACAHLMVTSHISIYYISAIPVGGQVYQMRNQMYDALSQ
jgi:hypothetical protein